MFIRFPLELSSPKCGNPALWPTSWPNAIAPFAPAAKLEVTIRMFPGSLPQLTIPDPNLPPQ